MSFFMFNSFLPTSIIHFITNTLIFSFLTIFLFMGTKKLNLQLSRFILDLNCALCAFWRFSIIYDVSNLNLTLIFFGRYLNLCFITTFFVFNSFFFPLPVEETGLGVLERSSSIAFYNSSPLEEFTALFLILFFLVSLLLKCSSVFTMNILIFGVFFVPYFFIRAGQKLYLDSKERFPDLPASADAQQRAEYDRLIKEHILAEQRMAEQDKITRANLASASAHQKVEYNKVIEQLAERLKNLTPEDKKKWLEEHERNLKRDLERLKNPSDQDKKDD